MDFSCTTTVFGLSSPMMTQLWLKNRHKLWLISSIRQFVPMFQPTHDKERWRKMSSRSWSIFTSKYKRQGWVQADEVCVNMRRGWVNEVIFLMQRDGGLSLTMFIPLQFATVRFKEFTSIASPRCGRTIAHYSLIRVALDERALDHGG